MNVLNLNGKWKVRDEDLACKGVSGLTKTTVADSGWIAATVPGEIHLDLVRAGRMEEPLVSVNAKDCRWPEKRSWWFVKTFKAAPRLLRCERQQLVFDGLDLYAQVFLNGDLLGESRNAFVPAVFDVRHRLQRGANTLAVRLTAGAEQVPRALRPKVAPRSKVYGDRMSFPGISRLRKPQFTYGWDWVDALPNIGIWRGVRIEGHWGIVLHDLSFSSRIVSEDLAYLETVAIVENLHPWSERTGELELTIAPPKGKAIVERIPLSAQIGRSPVEAWIEIKKPMLWWPNGMGGQPLYHVTARVTCDGRETDCREFDIGIRTVDIDREAMPAGGSRFCIRVNGHDVFCKGGNWIPADAIIARVTPEKHEALVGEARNAHMNMLRIWGGGVYESPDFYTACDRAGILVWQDFMFACAQYPDAEPEFRQAIRAEAEAVVRRLRHHPCIALWSGNNENVWGFAEWWNNDRSTEDKNLQIGGSILYNQTLPDVCRALDPDRPYWPGSPFGGHTPNSEEAGDCHWWWPGTMNPDINRRISHETFDECRSRFVSEYGVIGPCHPDSVKQYLKPDERHVESRAWKEHTNTFEKAAIPAAVQRHYADIEGLSLADYTLYGQLFQATMYGRTIEALRFRRYDAETDCQGALIWMFNDCWGETGWTPIDYYLRRKPSFYWLRNAFAPVKAIVRRRGEALITRVINDTLDHCAVEAHFGWVRLDGTVSRVRSKRLQLEPNSMQEIRCETIPPASTLCPTEWIYAAYLTGKGIEPCPSCWLLAPYRELDVPRPDIRVESKGHSIHLSSNVFCHAVHCEDGGLRVFSDNYFDLLPGLTKVIQRVGEKLPTSVKFRAVLG